MSHDMQQGNINFFFYPKYTKYIFMMERKANNSSHVIFLYDYYLPKIRYCTRKHCHMSYCELYPQPTQSTKTYQNQQQMARANGEYKTNK